LEETEGSMKVARGKYEWPGRVVMQKSHTHVKDMSNDNYQIGLEVHAGMLT